MESKRVPEVRFAGFSGEWEENQVKDIAPLQRGFDLPTSEVKLGSYPVVMSNGVSTYHSKFKVKAPGVVTGRSGTIGKLTFVKSNYWPHNTALWVTDFKGNDPKFIYHFYQKLNLKRYGSGSGVPTLNRNDVHNAKASIPNIAEQKQISSLFDSFDNSITLQQQELDTLKQTKQGFLQKMFPKEGESLPEVRFSGFSEVWEEVVIGDILLINSGRDYKHLNKGDVPVYGTGGYMRSVDKFLSDVNAIGIGRKGTIDKPQLLIAPFWTVDTLFYMTIKNRGDLFFMLYSIIKIEWKKYNESTGVPSLLKSTIDKIAVNIPSLEEQTQIGNFFKQLDDTIALHQKELDVLKETKKAFSQKMFV